MALSKYSPGSNSKTWATFTLNTTRVVFKHNKWMEDDFFKDNGFREAIERRISDLEAAKASRPLAAAEVTQLKSLKGSDWLS